MLHVKTMWQARQAVEQAMVSVDEARLDEEEAKIAVASISTRPVVMSDKTKSV